MRAMDEARLDGLVCALPTNILLLTGYWPVVGTSVAISARNGRLILLVPEDEATLARRGWADEVRTFRPGSLRRLTDAGEVLRVPLMDAAQDTIIESQTRSVRIGYERYGGFAPSSYASLHLHGAAIGELLGSAFPSAALVAADMELARLREVKTTHEIARIRAACSVAAGAFVKGAVQLRPGLREFEAASLFRAHLSAGMVGSADSDGAARADGFVYCMSGQNSAQAGAAYARSRDRRIEQGDLVLVHCNSYVDGYWTDITRTFCMGGGKDKPDPRQSAMYSAVLDSARTTAGVVRPGALGKEIDSAARQPLAEAGFGERFTHGTGHGVGFANIDHNAHPRLHPASDDVLQPGMVFNIEPAVYIEDYGGLRHCDMVAVTEGGCELLTPFQSRIEELLIPGAASTR